MEITWYGHSCFRIAERGLGSVVCDPYDASAIGYEPLKLKADIVTISNEKPGHSCMDGIKTEAFTISRPGEYEINNIFVTGHASHKKGEPRNTIFSIEMNGTTVVHLGNLNRSLTSAETELLGYCTVLLLPVGGGSGLNASQAVEVVRQLQPQFVIPMHYAVPRTIPQLDPLPKFLKEMGVSFDDAPLTSFKVPSMAKRDESSMEETKVVVLQHPLGNEMNEEGSVEG